MSEPKKTRKIRTSQNSVNEEYLYHSHYFSFCGWGERSVEYKMVDTPTDAIYFQSGISEDRNAVGFRADLKTLYDFMGTVYSSLK